MKGNATCRRLWYDALNEPLGLWLRTPDVRRLKSLMYATRAALKDPTLDHLEIRTPPLAAGHDLWIINPRIELGAEA